MQHQNNFNQFETIEEVSDEQKSGEDEQQLNLSKKATEIAYYVEENDGEND